MVREQRYSMHVVSMEWDPVGAFQNIVLSIGVVVFCALNRA